MSAGPRLGGTITLGKRPLPLCMKIKRIGGWPASKALDAFEMEAGSINAPVPKADDFKKSLLVFIILSSLVVLLTIHE
jgi:hypothetical protein